MALLTRESLSKRPFVDKRHYPYGFSRSGDFSISESKLLTSHGSLIAALVDGELTPETAEERGYIDVALGLREPQSATEKAWLKYQNRINRPKTASIYGSAKVAASDDDDDETDSVDDTGLEIEVDDEYFVNAM